ncbi:MAG: FlgO family outer membrane protein [Nitrospinota bacterium]
MTLGGLKRSHYFFSPFYLGAAVMRYFFWGIFLLVLSCSSPPKRPSTDTREDVKPEVFSRQKRQVVPPQQVAAFIVDELFDKNPNIQGKRIGVLSFSDATGKLSAAGTLLSEKVISELTSRKSGTVVERKNLKRILEEQKLNMSGVTTDSGQEAGTVLGVDVLLSGSITPLAGKNQITAKVTDVKTGEIYSAVGLTTQGDGFGKKGGKVGKGLVAGSSGSDEIFREEFERLKVRNPPGIKKYRGYLKDLIK